MGYGERVGFVISGVAGMGSSPLVFVGHAGVTRSFGILNLGICAVIAPGINLKEEDCLFHGGSFGNEGVRGSSPDEREEEEVSELGISDDEEDVKLSDVVEE